MSNQTDTPLGGPPADNAAPRLPKIKRRPKMQSVAGMKNAANLRSLWLLRNRKPVVCRGSGQRDGAPAVLKDDDRNCIARIA